MVEAFLRPNETVEQFYNRCTNLSVFDCSEEEMLTLTMGPKRLPLSQIVPYSVVLMLLFITGAVGNVVVCLVIVRHPALHTATNYYLFSLALSDLLLLSFGKRTEIIQSDTSLQRCINVPASMIFLVHVNNLHLPALFRYSFPRGIKKICSIFYIIIVNLNPVKLDVKF